MSAPETILRGGCMCGAIRYAIAAEPMFGGQCQCRDCQHESGGGHASFMAFPSAAVRLDGAPRFYEFRPTAATGSGAASARPAAAPSSVSRAACRR